MRTIVITGLIAFVTGGLVFAIVTLDTGNACLQAADRLAHYQTPGLVTPLDFGLVGFGYAAALGVQAATPDRRVPTTFPVAP